MGFILMLELEGVYLKQTGAIFEHQKPNSLLKIGRN